MGSRSSKSRRQKKRSTKNSNTNKNENVFAISDRDDDNCVDKPVIYLYPENPMDISIELKIKNSKFTCVYPKFNGKNKWKVHAKPNGDIMISDKIYPYLFWEAQSYNKQNMNKGFIVKSEDAENFLEEKLKILGLNDKESTDFITYWLPVLISNKLSLCTFQTEEFFKNFELNINPKPDSLLILFHPIRYSKAFSFKPFKFLFLNINRII